MINSFTFCENTVPSEENISSFTFSYKDQEGIETPDVVWHRLEKIHNSVRSENQTRINQWYDLAAQQHLEVVLTRNNNNNNNNGGGDLEMSPSSQDSSVVALSQPNDVQNSNVDNKSNFPHRRQQQNVEATNSVLLPDEVFSSHTKKNHNSFFPCNISNSLLAQKNPMNFRPLGFWNFPNVVEFIDALSPYFPPMTNIPPQFFALLLRDAEEYTNFCFEARKRQQQQHQQQVFAQQLRQNKASQTTSSSSSTTNCLWSSKFPIPSQYSSLHASTNRREVFLQFKSWLESYVPDEELKRKFGTRRNRHRHRHDTDNDNNDNSRRRQRDNCDNEEEEEDALNVTANIMTMKIIGNNKNPKRNAKNSAKNARNVNTKDEDAALKANQKTKEETELEIYQDILGIGNSNKNRQHGQANNNAFLGSNGKPIPGILGLPLSITSQDSPSSSPNFLSLANRKFPSMLMMVSKPANSDPNPNKIFDNPNNEFRGFGINEMTGQRVSARILEQEALLRKKQEAAERKRRRQKGYFPNFERQLKREFVPGEAIGASGDVTNVVVLCGATGIGTTQFVAQLAQHFDVDVVECNPSMRRNAASLEKLISEATQAKQIKKNNNSSSSCNNNNNNNQQQQQQNSEDNKSGKIQNQNSFFSNVNSLQSPSTSTTSAATSALSKLDQMFQENKRRKELEEKAIQENSKKKSATRAATKAAPSDISKFFTSSRSTDSSSTTASSSVAPSDKSTIVGVVDVDAASSPLPETKKKNEKKAALIPPASNNNSTAPADKKSGAKSSSSLPPPPAPKKSFFNVPTSTVAISSKRNPQPFPSNVGDAVDQKNAIETSKTHEGDDDDDVLLLLSSHEETSSSSLSPITISSCSQTSSNSSDLMEMLPPPPASATTISSSSNSIAPQTVVSTSSSEIVPPKPAAKPRGRPRKVENILEQDAAPREVPVAAIPAGKKSSVSATAGAAVAVVGKKKPVSKKASGAAASNRKHKASSSDDDDDDDDDASSSNSSSSSDSSSSDSDSDAGNSFLQNSNLEASGKGLYSIVLIEGGDIVCNDEGGFHAALRRLTQDARCPVIVTANPANCPEALAASLGCPLVFLDSVSTIHEALATGLMISQVNAARNKSGKMTKLFEAASSSNCLAVSPLSPNFSSCSNSPPTSPFSYESNNTNNGAALFASSSSGNLSLQQNINLNGKTRYSSAAQSQTLRGIVNALVCFSVLSAEIEIAKIGAIETNLVMNQIQKSNLLSSNDNNNSISCGMSQDAAIELFDLSPIDKNNNSEKRSQEIFPTNSEDGEDKIISFLNNSASRKRGLPQEKVKCVLVNLVRWLRRRDVLLSNNNNNNGSSNNKDSISSSSNALSIRNTNMFPSVPSSSSSAGTNPSASSSSLDVRKMLNDLQWVTLPALKSDNFNFFFVDPMSNRNEDNSSKKILIDAHEIDSRIVKICHELGSLLSGHSGDKSSNNVLEIHDDNEVENDNNDDDDDSTSHLPSCLLKFTSILDMNQIEILSDRFYVSQQNGLDEYSTWEENRRRLKQLETSFVNATSAMNNNNNNNNNNIQANKNVTSTANNVGKASVTFAAFFSGGGNKNLAAVTPAALPQPSATTNSNASVNNNTVTADNNNNVSSSSNNNSSHNNSATVRIRAESEMNRRFGNMRSAKWAKEYYGTRGQHAVNDVASYFNFLRRK